MTAVEVFRADRTGPVPLVEGPNGYPFSEGETVLVVVRSARLPRLTLCGSEIAASLIRQEGDRFRAEFRRLIDMWAGRTFLILEDGDGSPRELRLDIAPSRSKLGPGAWDSLIQELCEVSASLPWGMGQGGASGQLTRDALNGVHPAIIEHQLPIFLKLLRRYLADPPVRTVRIRTVRPLDLGRRADLQTLRWLGRHPVELNGLRGDVPREQAPEARVLASQPDALSSWDHPLTRYLAWLLDRLGRRLAATEAALSGNAGHGVFDAEARAYANQLASRVASARRTIELARKAPLLRRASPEPLSDSALQSLPDQPLYAALHRTARQLLAPGLAYAPGQDIVSALKHSYDLFELLVLYRLAAALNHGLPEGWTSKKIPGVDRLPHEDRPRDRARWSWVGAGGWSLELVYQARFGRARPPPHARPQVSLSAKGVPDFILVARRDGELRSWLILDAKYRAGRQSIDDALGDLHRYRDALRLETTAPTAAYIVTPSLQPAAAFYGEPGYLARHRFGALRLYENGWLDPVWTWFGKTTAT